MSKQSLNRYFAATLAAFHLLVFAPIPMAQASMLGTADVLHEQHQQVEREQLLGMLDDAAVKEKLAAMGVDRSQVEQRINSLTPAELAQFNQQLSEAPAGAGVVGIIVLFLVIFIITDLLCATNIFPFIKCIN